MTELDLAEAARAALGTGPLTPLARGGQKFVFRTTLEGQDVVLKLLEIPETTYAEPTLERAQREVELLSSIDSPHVVGVLSEAIELGDRPDAVAWVEQYLEGTDLTPLLATAPWTDADIIHMLGDVAEGLHACHELDVVHRDLSPGNVRVLPDGRYVLMDPGFARHLSKFAITGVYNPGTPGFMSPEHIPSGSPITASDIFCLGILAYIAATGSFPVAHSGDDDEYFAKLRMEQVPSVAASSSVSEPVAQIIDRCLQRQSARRYIDAEELLSDLRYRDLR